MHTLEINEMAMVATRMLVSLLENYETLWQAVCSFHGSSAQRVQITEI